METALVNVDDRAVRALKEHAATEILRQWGISLEALHGTPTRHGDGVLDRLDALQRENERLRRTVGEQGRTIELLRGAMVKE